MNNLPVLLVFCLSSLGVDGLCVVFVPQKLAVFVRLFSLVAQIYETIVVHSDLNVFGT